MLTTSILPILFSLISLISCRTITVRTNLATLIGNRDSKFETDVFINVPFAQSPTGPRRLQPPVAITVPQGKLSVAGPPVSCLQPKQLPFNASEDCLTLDIVRPAQISAKKPVPVYVFIHGGSFVFGDKAGYDGKNLVSKSAKLGAPFIYVAINYRLGFLGFPSGSEAAANNALNLGLLDQRMALQWVKDSIAAFGGDPSKIVIGGQETGADCVAYHLLANDGKNDNLFRGAILESGSATAASPIPPPTYQKWQDEYNSILQTTGCNVNGTDHFKCLQNTNTLLLSGAVYRNLPATSNFDPAQIYGPVVDGKFLTQNVSVAIKQHKFVAVPTLLGTTTDEIIVNVPSTSGLNSEPELAGYGQVSLPWSSAAFLQELRTYYPVSQYPNTGPPGSGSQYRRAVAIVNDLRQFCPASQHAIEFATVAPVWKYRWNAVMETKTVPSYLGVPQGSELDYLFPINGRDMGAQSPADLALISIFQRSIISFINHLNPNAIAPNGSPPLNWNQDTLLDSTRLVFQRPGSDGKLSTERDIVTEACVFINDNGAELLH